MRGGMLVLGVLFASGCASTQPVLQPHTAQALFDTGKGYRFAALPEPGANVVWLDVRYPVGFADDPPDKPGLAHLVEHLLFDVELDRDGRKISVDAELRRLSLAYNAFTAEDFTTYRTMVQPDHLDEVLRLERDRLEVGCAGLTPEIFAHERAVVVRELQTVRTPDDLRVDQLVRNIAYPPGHPYRSSATPASVAKLELADACQLLAAPYRRGEVLVVASGGVDQARLEHAAHAFDLLPARPPSIKPPLEIVTLRSEVSHHELHLRRPRLVALWALPSRDSIVYRMVRLVMTELPSYINRAHPGYAAEVALLGGARAPVLALSLTLHAENESLAAIDAVKEATEHVLIGLEHTKPADLAWRSLQHAKSARVLSGWDLLGDRNAAFADYLAFDHGTDYLADRLSELTTVVPEQVAIPLQLMLTDDRTRWLVLESSGAVRAQADPPFEAKNELVDFHEARVDPATADQPVPLPHAPPALLTESFQLDNGLTILLWPYGGTPVLRGALVIGSGWVNDPLGQEGIAQLFGSNENTVVTPDHVLISAQPYLPSDASMLIEDLEASLLLRWRLLDGAKQHLHKRVVGSRGTAKFEHDRRVALYGTRHAYSRSTINDDTLAAIDDEALTNWTDRHLVPSNATLIITGQFDATAVKQSVLASAHRRGWGTRNASRTVVEQAQPTRAWIAGKTGAADPSLELEVRFVGGRGIDEDHAKRLVLEEVMADKLLELRERTALSYVTQASYTPRLAGGLWSFMTIVDPARASEAGTALIEMLAQLRRDPETYRAAFVLARQKVLARLLVSSGSAQQVLDQLVERVRFHLEDDRQDRLAGEVAALTLTTFHAFVRRELAETGQVFSACGNGDAVDAALTAAQQAAHSTQ